jgi:pyruvate kinase
MSRICQATENNINYSKRFKAKDVAIKNIADAVSHSACNTAIDLNAAAIAVFTRSGMTARMVSRFRAETLIIGITDNLRAYRQLALSWGVYPVLTTVYNSTDELFNTAVNVCKELGAVKSGDIIVIAAGVPVGKSGLTNMIKVEEIK